MDDSTEKVLAAFRQVTGWTDEEVLHYLECDGACTPICGHEEYICQEGKLARGISKAEAGDTVFSADLNLEGQILKREGDRAQVWWSDDDVAWVPLRSLRFKEDS